MSKSEQQTFADVYKALNNSQKQAVDNIDGPMLVIAGPGTGKTQLLSARVANILDKTDTLPQNILCLTFTENGALNMRDRLTRFIGKDAYDVNIGTYHAFGGDLIRRFPEYFSQTHLQNPVDELGQHEIFSGLIEKLHYDNPLKPARHNIKDIIGTISEIKRSLLTSAELRSIAAENISSIKSTNLDLVDVFADFVRMPSKLDKARPYFAKTLQVLRDNSPLVPTSPTFGSFCAIAARDLETALELADAAGKGKSLTEWKNNWLVKDTSNHLVLDGSMASNRTEALADVLDGYQLALEERALYDFDDMILRSIEAIENHDDLRFTLQENYLYLLLDEFQDTNAAQLKLVGLLTNNPLSEGRPNVMAVGDDDQAIYAFQGAQYSNMMDFYRLYRETKVINLTENYRSTADILQFAGDLAGQIGARLTTHFENVDKTLSVSSHNLPATLLERREFLSRLAEYDYIAQKTAELIAGGTSPREIAVLAPLHRLLEPLVIHLNQRGIPVHYDKREDILQAPVVRQLITMSRLVLALSQGEEDTADALWVEVLSYDFWQLATSSIWQLAWQVADSPRENRTHWTKLLLEHGGTFRQAALLILGLAGRVQYEGLEAMLDYLIGSESLDSNEVDTPQLVSPLGDYYATPAARNKAPELFYETLSHLTVLRSRLRDYAATRSDSLLLSDFVHFVALYAASGTPMTNSSPYHQQADAVQLMTIYKAKGLEFEHIFLPGCEDSIWGAGATGKGNMVVLPANLAPIRHAGSNDDERLRKLFVAVTRARFGLHLTGSSSGYTGKPTKRLKYFDEQEQTDGSFRAQILPEAYQKILNDDREAPTVELLQLDWRSRHIVGSLQADLRSLLEERLQKYQISPTHLNSFTDLIYGGPDKFLLSTLLRFPSAPTLSSQFGNAIHETLEWYQRNLIETGRPPDTDLTLRHFAIRLKNKKLLPAIATIEQARGEKALRIYLEQRSACFSPTDLPEHNFRSENVHLDDVWMSGKIDKLVVDEADKTIIVVDYKTGSPHSKWASSPKLHKYKQQLYCYKLLVEHSRRFAGYKVTAGRLEFIEPDEHGQIQTLELVFDPEELEQTKQLLLAVWQRIQSLDFPEIADYQPTMAGIRQFEDDLRSGDI